MIILLWGALHPITASGGVKLVKIYVVDEKDQFVRKATRKEVLEKALLHRASRVLVENGKGELLVQKRSMGKDSYPGYWDISVAETVKEGESYEGTAMRGLMEELGIIGI